MTTMVTCGGVNRRRLARVPLACQNQREIFDGDIRYIKNSSLCLSAAIKKSNCRGVII